LSVQKVDRAGDCRGRKGGEKERWRERSLVRETKKLDQKKRPSKLKNRWGRVGEKGRREMIEEEELRRV